MSECLVASATGYPLHVIFLKDFKNDNIKINKGEIRSAFYFDNKVGMGDCNNIPYITWYSVYGPDIDDAKYAPRGTMSVDVDGEYVKGIYDKKEYLRRSLNKKLQKVKR